MKKDSLHSLSPITIWLHWIVAILMIGILTSGLYMTRWEDNSIYGLHKSFGMLLFIFAAARVAWRLYNGWPKPVNLYASWERLLAKVIHYLLIIGIIVMPVSGMLMTSMSGRPLVFFGATLIHTNVDAAGELLARSEALADMAHKIHELAAYIIIAAIALHVAGALKHHILDKDGTLRRMLGTNIS